MVDKSLLRKQYPMVKGFFSHGFEPKKQNGLEVIGECFFCGSEKFSVNVNKGTWKCWTGCGGGSYYDFLKKIAKDYKLAKDSIKLKELSEHKKVPAEILFKYDLAYNPKTDEFLIPEMLDDRITDLKRYKYWEEDGKIEKYFYSSPNTKKAYFANDRLDSEYIIVCEGEWDFFIADHVFTDMGVFCVPGATSFKEEWVSHFRNKTVFVCFDNDRAKLHKGKVVIGAADIGYIKIYKHLKFLVNNMAFLKWDKKLKNGYDVRDLWIDVEQNEDKVIEYITNNLVEKPPRYIEEKHGGGNEITHKTLYNTLDKWLKIDDKSGVDAVYGTIFANKIDTDPLWLMFIARSGFMKTTVIETLRGAKNTYHTSSITPASLAYGGHVKEGEEDRSLIKKWNGKTAIIKDLTTMLNGDPQNVANCFGILRDAYDGISQRNTAHNVASFKSKFGMICGVTPVIYDYAEGNTQYGERFLYYRAKDSLSLFEELGIVKAAMANTNKESRMVEDLQNIGKVLGEKPITSLPHISSSYENKIAHIAVWLSVFRGTVNRNKYRNNEVMGKALMEIGTRLAKQLKSFLLGVCLFKGKAEVDEQEYQLMRDVAMSSATNRLLPVFKYMLSEGLDKKFSHEELIAKTTYVEKIGDRIVEDLIILGVLKQASKSMVKTSITYAVTSKIKIVSSVVFN